MFSDALPKMNEFPFRRTDIDTNQRLKSQALFHGQREEGNREIFQEICEYRSAITIINVS